MPCDRRSRSSRFLTVSQPRPRRPTRFGNFGVATVGFVRRVTRCRIAQSLLRVFEFYLEPLELEVGSETPSVELGPQ